MHVYNTNLVVVSDKVIPASYVNNPLQVGLVEKGRWRTLVNMRSEGTGPCTFFFIYMQKLAA